MPKRVRQWLSLLVSTIGLVGFAYCYVVLFLGEWGEGKQPTENFLQLTAGLTGMVSGVVATMFGVKVPEVSDNKFQAWVVAAGGRICPIDHATAKVVLLVLYFIVYLVAGAWALSFWVGSADEFRPQIIDQLATVVFGIVVAIGSGHLGGSSE